MDDIQPERLWLQRPLEEDGETTRGVTGLRYNHDETKSIKKKFKAQPTTQAEVLCLLLYTVVESYIGNGDGIL